MPICAAAEAVTRHDHAGEPGDQGAVDVEESADFRAAGLRFDFGHRPGQAHVAVIERPVVGGAHDGELPLGDGGWTVEATDSAKDAGVARPSPPSASTSSNPASRQRAHRSSSVNAARS